jgi:hypothetical protein
MRYTSENLRYLLWNEDVKREEWVSTLATWLQCDTSRSTELLFNNRRLDPAEIENLIKAIHFVERDFESMCLIEEDQMDIPLMNIRYLLDSLKRGDRKILAESLDVHEVTISRWYAGSQVPSSRHYEALGEFFGLDRTLDIRTEPIFLSLEPVTVGDRKKWLQERIEQLDTIFLGELFPVLRRLLQEE